MTEPSRIRILIADDHPVFREGLAALIGREDDMEVVAEAADGRQAVALYREHRPDVVLIDLRMPELGGAEAIEAIRREAPRSHIIVLTTYGGAEDVYRALTAGARGYLLKDTSRRELLEAIREVHAGRRKIPEPIAAQLARRLGREPLTGRELDVLERLAGGDTNREIAGALGLTEGTVKNHVNHILGKLGARDRTEAATMALTEGIVRRGPPAAP